MNFPELNKDIIVGFKKSIDSAFKEFAGTWGESLQDALSPIHWGLKYLERFLLAMPWYVFLLLTALIIWRIARSWRLVLGAVSSLIAIGLLGMWDDTMRTISIVVASTVLCIVLGIPIGILMSYKKKAQTIILPILDLMQTIPSFVYLIRYFVITLYHHDLFIVRVLFTHFTLDHKFLFCNSFLDFGLLR